MKLKDQGFTEHWSLNMITLFSPIGSAAWRHDPRVAGSVGEANFKRTIPSL